MEGEGEGEWVEGGSRTCQAGEEELSRSVNRKSLIIFWGSDDRGSNKLGKEYGRAKSKKECVKILPFEAERERRGGRRQSLSSDCHLTSSALSAPQRFLLPQPKSKREDFGWFLCRSRGGCKGLKVRWMM